MTDQSGAVYDLGYEPFEGDRKGRSGARRALYFDGIRRVLGLRRKARRKVMPWILLLIAVIPPIVIIGVSFLIPDDAPGGIDLSSQNARFLILAGTVTMLFTALSAPELLVPDRRDGVLSMLASRPLTAIDYLGTRFASLVSIVGAFTIIPQLVLYVGQAGMDTEGMFRGLVNAADTLPKIAASVGVFTIAYVPLGFLIASVSKRKSVATAIYLIMMISLTSFAEVFVRETNIEGGRWVALLGLIPTANEVTLWIFDEMNPRMLLSVADIHPSLGVAALGVVGTLSAIFSFMRYRKLI